MNQPIKGIKMAEVASKQTDVRMDVWLGHCKQEADQITDTLETWATQKQQLWFVIDQAECSWDKQINKFWETFKFLMNYYKQKFLEFLPYHTLFIPKHKHPKILLLKSTLWVKLGWSLSILNKLLNRRRCNIPSNSECENL